MATEESIPIRLVDNQWEREFSQGLTDYPDELLIVSPFIKANAIEALLHQHSGRIKVITRFNLVDFAQSASDIPTLRRLLSHKAKIRGVRNLHAKLYVFGASRAIVASANFTEGGLSRNHELGVVVQSLEGVAACVDYFNGLWNKAKSNLRVNQLNQWEKIVSPYLQQKEEAGYT